MIEWLVVFDALRRSAAAAGFWRGEDGENKGDNI